MEIALLIIGSFFAGFVDSVAGGGGLISLPLLLYLGVPTKVALGTNKVIGIAASFSSTLRYAFSKNIIWSIALPSAAFGLIGGSVGAYLATIIPNEVLQPLVIFLLLFIAIYSLMQKKMGR